MLIGMSGPFGIAQAASDPTVEYQSSGNAATGTISALSVSSSASTLVFPVLWRASSGRTISSATFNGSACTVDQAGVSANQSAGLLRIANPGPGSYDLVVTLSGSGLLGMAAACYALSNATTFATSQVINLLSSGTGTITLTATGPLAMVGGMFENGTGSATWDWTTGTIVPTEDVEGVMNGNRGYSFCSQSTTGSYSSSTLIGDSSAGGAQGAGVAGVYTA